MGLPLLLLAPALLAGGPNLWPADLPMPRTDELAPIPGVRFAVIKPYAFATDGYRFLHGVALCWHDGRLYASFGHNQGGENTATEEARYTVSDDGGRTWSAPATIDRGDELDLGISHGVFWSHQGQLWAFQGAYRGTMTGVHTRAYRLDQAARRWLPEGTGVEGGFWPMQPPQRMADSNWVMAGISVGGANPAAVAISHGDDARHWDLVRIPPAEGTMWGESTVIVDGAHVLNIARYGAQATALVATSDDCGRTWTASAPSNLPMVTSKPFAGVLSTGQRYLIATTTADSGTRRSPLTIALSRPGEAAFSQVRLIRGALWPNGPGESHRDAALSYPYAVEHDGYLYVGYSNNGGNVGRVGTGRELWNNNSAELAVIPLASLRSAE